jgi:GNAT superfamily N-acetyltransferase
MRLRIAEHEEDFRRISHFRKTFQYHGADSLRRSMEPEYYQWKCGGSPAVGRGFLFFMEEAGQVVATISVCPKPLRVGGLDLRGAELCDGFTSPDHQHRGLFTQLVRESCAESERSGIQLLYGTPDVRTSLAPLVRKCGFVEVTGTRIRYAVLPVRPRELIADRWRWRPAALAAAGAGGAALALLNAPWIPFGRRYEVEFHDRLPDRLLAFAASCRAAGATGVDRHEDYLRWRYVRNPDPYLFIGLRDRAGHDAALAVCKEGRKGGTGVLYVADLFFSPQAGPAGMAGLLQAVRHRAQAAGMDLVALWNPFPGSGRRLVPWLSGFLPYRRIQLILHRNRLAEDLGVTGTTWDLSMGDSDNI